ncbi:MAG: phenylalanyl-tRNA synthetase beta chain, partial [Kiritimatiellia bacterium]
MKIRTSVLSRYIDIPKSTRDLRDLLDDVGLEVKRTEQLPGDLSITLELLANRGDHHSYSGISREIGGRTAGSLRRPEVTTLQVGRCPIVVEVRSPLCLRYSATLLERTGPVAQLPDDVLRPIVAAGQKCVRAEVDATNLANLELGQPTHVFDADTIVGAVVVREAVAGETCLPLFFEARVDVPVGALVVADDVKILAVAGVIGCEECKATQTTTRLLVESATFEPVAVRKAARAMGIATDSSARFERGADPEAPLVGAGRVVFLLELYAGWSRVGQTAMLGKWAAPKRIITLSVPLAGAFLEVPLAEAEIRERLERYGFSVSPSWPEWDAGMGWTVPDELVDAPHS